MKLQFIIIIIALSVTIASTSLWPLESLVCSIESNCSSSNDCLSCPLMIDCYKEGDNESSDFNIAYQTQCTCDSCNVTISPNKMDCTANALPPLNLVLNHNYTGDYHHNCSVCVSNSSTLLAELTNCGSPKGLLCWILIGFGCVISLLLVIILTLCGAIVYLLAKGRRYKYTPNVVLTQSSTDQNQIQEEQPPPSENQDSGGQQPNLYHILDPQYETVDNKTTKPTATPEPSQYCEPEPSSRIKAEVMEQKGLTGSGAQPSKLKASLEKNDEQDTGVFYDELTGRGYPKSLKSSELSATSLPTTAVPNYSSLNAENGTEQQDELIPLYSMPDKSKKKDKDGGKKTRETELTMSQSLMVKSPTESKPPFTRGRRPSGQGGEIGLAKPPRTPSPPPPMLPPKPGQTSKMAESIQEEGLEDVEEEAYAEVSSRPMVSAQSRNKTPGTIGMTVSPLHLMSQNLSSTTGEAGTGSFRRSYSMEGYFGSEVLRLQKASDMDFRQLYDEPMNPSLHTRGGMSPHQERQEEEEEMERQGFFRAS